MTNMYSPVSLMNAIYNRYSVRSYLPRFIDEASIRELLSAAVQAPTGLDLEPWAFVVVQDKTLLQRLSDHCREFFLQEMNRSYFDGTGYGDVASNFNLFSNAGTLILICAKSKGPFVVPDCWLAAENLMLAAYAMELGSCVVGSALIGLNTMEVKVELGIPDSYSVIVPIILGTPSGSCVPAPRKKPRILSWKRENMPAERIPQKPHSEVLAGTMLEGRYIGSAGN